MGYDLVLLHVEVLELFEVFLFLEDEIQGGRVLAGTIPESGYRNNGREKKREKLIQLCLSRNCNVLSGDGRRRIFNGSTGRSRNRNRNRDRGIFRRAGPASRCVADSVRRIRYPFLGFFALLVHFEDLDLPVLGGIDQLELACILQAQPWQEVGGEK